MLACIYSIALTLYLITPGFSLLCSRGEYLHTTANDVVVCLPCDPDTFMPLTNHAEGQCYKCTRVLQPELEISISECNLTNDRIIGCKGGYYRTAKGKNAVSGACVMCDTCKHVGRRCQNDSNAICCPGDDYYVIDNKCQKKPFVCGPGEYKSEDNCLPCKDNTFNSFSDHSYFDCKICSKPDNIYEIEVRPCNKTHDTVIRCTEEHFWKDSGVNGVKGMCTICKNCSHSPNKYVGRNCIETNDTVCCTRLDMEVNEAGQCVDKAQVPTPTPVIVTCGQGQYLDNKNNDMEPTCAACSNGTYQDKVNHTDTGCQNCTEFKGQHLPQTCTEREKTTPTLGHFNVLLVIGISSVAICIALVCFCVFWCCNRLCDSKRINIEEDKELDHLV